VAAARVQHVVEGKVDPAHHADKQLLLL